MRIRIHFEPKDGIEVESFFDKVEFTTAFANTPNKWAEALSLCCGASSVAEGAIAIQFLINAINSELTTAERLIQEIPEWWLDSFESALIERKKSRAEHRD